MDNIKTTIRLKGMADDGLLWCQEMGGVTYGGQNILNLNFYSSSHITTSTTGFSGLTGNFNCMCDYAYGTDDRFYVAGMNATGSKMYLFHPYTTPHHGLINTIQAGGSSTDQIAASSYGDILQSSGGHILYSSCNHLGVAYRLTVGSATATSITVTGATLNATYGVDSDAGTNKVYNLTKKEIYTNTTNNPTDTLNFTTAAVTPQAGDKILVFIDNRFKFNTSSVVDNHFVGQDTTSNWVRQIVLFGSEYFILNGNYLASLDNTSQTFSATAKQLPYNTQATCMGINNSQILVGGRAVNNTGRLCLWDGSSDGWLSILELSTAPSAIQSYKNGWLVFVNGQIIFTNGYEIQKLTSVPDVEVGFSYMNINYNGFVVSDDKLFIASATYDYNRVRCGIYIYDILRGTWSFTPYKTVNGTPSQGIDLTCLYPYVYSSRRLFLYGINAEIGKVFAGKNSSGGNKQIIVGFANLPKKIRVSKIELNLAYGYNSYLLASGSSDVTVSVGDGKNSFFNRAQADSTSTTTTIYNVIGDSNPGIVGQEFEVTGDDYAYAGARSFIQSIADAGTVNEAWTISPALPANLTADTEVLTFGLKTCGTKTITSSTLLSTLTYSVSNFQSDKLYFEVVIDGTMPVDVYSINIY